MESSRVDSSSFGILRLRQHGVIKLEVLKGLVTYEALKLSKWLEAKTNSVHAVFNEIIYDLELLEELVPTAGLDNLASLLINIEEDLWLTS